MKHKEKRIQGRENNLGKVPEGERSMSVRKRKKVWLEKCKVEEKLGETRHVGF